MQPAHALIASIMRACDAFVGGAAQYDDITLIAARLLERDNYPSGS